MTITQRKNENQIEVAKTPAEKDTETVHPTGMTDMTGVKELTDM
eukprot:CAMPEP_0206204966 /NCGR_PEP_ID=MMETSP0166-20121206/13892_1 /ASSEMBLY_ACC=CAM_ASM_000260 /TAXON_ID=95228 /ORGANISM="Vannella robusta, Strain DIVA3 518/3/11/1/6" /LENGTH=43 /DNA_ID= /DNA_START= /DNA_END= /DNA_ORIENTATION=